MTSSSKFEAKNSNSILILNNDSYDNNKDRINSDSNRALPQNYQLYFAAYINFSRCP